MLCQDRKVIPIKNLTLMNLEIKRKKRIVYDQSLINWGGLTYVKAKEMGSSGDADICGLGQQVTVGS